MRPKSQRHVIDVLIARSLTCVCPFLIILSCALVVSGPVWAESEAMKGGMSEKALMKSGNVTWKISADRISYDQKRKTYLAEGNILITSEGRTIKADWAELDTIKRQAELSGNVFLQFGQDWIWGDHVFWNLDKGTGWVNGGLAYFARNHFYVHGDYIAKTGKDEYDLRSGFVTSCDPAHPDWDIRYRRMNIQLDGIAWVTDPSLWVRDSVPLFYFPGAALPIKRGRQSGFLIPWAGTSKLNGFELEVPYYWVMREDMDATFFGRYMTERGFMSGLEYRIDNNTYGKGIWLFNYLQDEAGKNHLASEGYPFQQDDRYWLRARHIADLPYQVKGFLDLDYASDRNLLNEFTGGSISYSHSNRIFQSYMGRGILDDNTILARESSIYLERPFESSMLALDTRYWEQLVTGLQDSTIQRLPSLSYNVIPSWIGGTPLYYTLDSSWVNYWRETGDRGNRLDLRPKIYYPMHWNTYLDLQTSAGFHASSYWVDWQGESHDPWQERFFPEASLGLSSRLNRVYPLNLGDYVAIQHAIRPEIDYEYIPETSQGRIPQFDRLDQSLARHDIRYGFTSFLTTKEIHKNQDGNEVTNYQEIARLQVFQAYNLEATQQDFFDTRFNTVAQKGFSDINMRLDFMPKKYVSFTYDTDVSPDEGSATLQSAYVTLDSTKGQTLSVGYQFRENTDINEIIGQINFKVLPNVTLTAYQDYALHLKELFSQGYGVTYQHGCWALGLSYEKVDKQETVTATVNLLGLGTFGYKGGGSSGPVIAGPTGGPVKVW